MPSGQQPFTSPKLEYLELEQAAAICAVSEDRFNKWIEKGIVPVIHTHQSKLIRSLDLIQHLIRHNIPVPDRLLQGNYKKILFVLTERELPQADTVEIIKTLFKLKKKSSLIFDFVRQGENVELKIITLRPDIIVLLLHDPIDMEPENIIRQMVNEALPVHTVATSGSYNLEALLCE